jgi:predicted  nucleic acid-binding Zn-ribbon protein
MTKLTDDERDAILISINEKLKILSNDTAGLKTAVDSLQTSVGSLETAVDSLQTSVIALEVRISALEVRLSRVEAELNKKPDRDEVEVMIKREVDPVKKELAQMRQELAQKPDHVAADTIVKTALAEYPKTEKVRQIVKEEVHGSLVTETFRLVPQ